MRFQLLLTTFLLFTLASGLVVPPRISERNEHEDSLQTRQFIAKDFDDVDGRSIFGLVKGALGAVKGIGKVAKSVVGAVKGVAKGAGSVAKSVASKAGSVAKKAGGAAKKAATATKNVAKKAATKTKGVAKKAATKTKSAASKAGTKTKNAAKKVSTKAKNAGTKVKDAVNPKGPKAKYHVPAGGGKPGQTYTRKDVKTAVKNANAEHQKLKAPGTSNTQKKKSMLKPFGNNNHHVQKPGSPGPNSLPKMKGKGHEYPLRNSAQGPATAKDKGPARVITQENKKGKLKFKGVVAHDQSRKQGDPGYNDHFQIKGGRK